MPQLINNKTLAAQFYVFLPHQIINYIALIQTHEVSRTNNLTQFQQQIQVRLSEQQMSTAETQKQQRSFGDFETENKLEGYEQTKPRNFGNLIPLLMDPQTNQPKYSLGPHFYLFIPTWLVSVGLILYILVSMRHSASVVLMILSTVSSIIFLYYYAMTGLSSPGIASSAKQLDALQRYNQRYCVPCRIIKPIGTQHCYYCDVCIPGIDHHCPWVGKCIGSGNLCLFYKLLASVGCVMAILLATALTANQNTSQSGNPNFVKI